MFERFDTVNVGIKGLDVKFETKPSEGQLRFIEKVIETLQDSKNAVCETSAKPVYISSLLIRSFAWLENLKIKSSNAHRRTKILFFYDKSPDKVLSEVEKSCYNPRISVIDTRESLCMNTDLDGKDEIAKQCKCLTLVEGQICRHFEDLKRKYNEINLMLKSRSALVTKELLKFGEDKTVCPYYLAMSRATQSQMVVLPQSFLSTPHLQREVQGLLSDSVIIVEESSKLVGHAETATGKRITQEDFPLISNELVQIKEFLAGLGEFDPSAREMRVKMECISQGVLSLSNELKYKHIMIPEGRAYIFKEKEFESVMEFVFLRSRRDYFTLKKYKESEEALLVEAQNQVEIAYGLLVYLIEKRAFVEY